MKRENFIKLVKQLHEQGDQEVNGELISHTIIKALIPIAKVYHKYPEGVSVGFLTICTCVNKINELDSVDAFDAYVKKTVRWRVMDHLRKYFKFPIALGVVDYVDAVESNNLLLEELLPVDSIERTIVEAIMEGYNNNEVAELCNLKNYEVSRIRNELMEQYKWML